MAVRQNVVTPIPEGAAFPFGRSWIGRLDEGATIQLSRKHARMRFSVKVGVAVGLTLGSIAALAFDARPTGRLAVLAAWIRPPSTGATKATGYIKIRNMSGEADRILAIESPAAERVTVNDTGQGDRHEPDKQKSELLRGLEVPGLATVLFPPSGRDLAFLGLKAPLREGDEVPVTVTFERGGALELFIPVRRDPTADTQGQSLN